MSNEQPDLSTEGTESTHAARPKPGPAEFAAVIRVMAQMDKNFDTIRKLFDDFDWIGALKEEASKKIKEKVATNAPSDIEPSDDPDAAKIQDPNLRKIMKRFGPKSSRSLTRAAKEKGERTEFKLEVIKVLNLSTGSFADVFDPVENMYSSIQISIDDYFALFNQLANGEKAMIELDIKEFQALAFTPTEPGASNEN